MLCIVGYFRARIKWVNHSYYNALTFVNTTAIAYKRKISQSLNNSIKFIPVIPQRFPLEKKKLQNGASGFLVIYNSSCVHKYQDITSSGGTKSLHIGLGLWGAHLAGKMLAVASRT